jgi:hypothetical protein
MSRRRKAPRGAGTRSIRWARMEDDRRRSRRHPVEVPARLELDDGVEADVVIRNIGELGALVSMADLEISVAEGDRVIIEHPEWNAGKFGTKKVRRTGSVVRVDMELAQSAVLRQLAIFFDGGPSPRPPAA